MSHHRHESDDDVPFIYGLGAGAGVQVPGATPHTTAPVPTQAPPPAAVEAYRKPAWVGKDLPKRAKRKPHPLYVSRGGFDYIDPKKNLKPDDEEQETFAERQKRKKQQLLDIMGTKSDTHALISEIHVSPKGHSTVVFHDQQQAQLVQDRSGAVATVRFLTNQMDSHRAKFMMEALESKGALVDIDNLSELKIKGSRKFQKLLRESMNAVQAERVHHVEHHFLQLAEQLRKQIGNTPSDAPNLAQLKERHRIADTISSAVAYGDLSNKDVGKLFKLTDAGQKTAGAAYGLPTWAGLREIAAKHDGVGAQPDMQKAARRGPPKPMVVPPGPSI